MTAQIDSPGDHATYGPIAMPWAIGGGCLLLAQEEALEALYGLIARVNKNAEAKRELTVAGPKGKQFEKCAKEAMKLIKSNYAKGILDRSDDTLREGEHAEQPKTKKKEKAKEEAKQQRQLMN